MKALLIAKPWKGGLGRYFFTALQTMFPNQVEWIATRPQSLAERIAFRRDPKAWWQALLHRIENTPCEAAFFISHRKEFRALKPKPHYVLYIVDDVKLTPADAGTFSKIYLSDPGYEAELRAVCAPVQFGGVLPFAHCKNLHRPLSLAGATQKAEPRDVGHDLCFIGNRDGKRDPLLERLFKEGLRPLIIGNYFMKSPLFWRYPLHFRPGVPNAGMAAIYARHKIALNIHAKVVREGTNMRSFECAGFGIPQIVEYRPGIESYFEPNKEILLYRDGDEMVAQIRRLLRDPAGAKAMAEAARRRALAEHTYEHRLKTALGHLLKSG
ncbi:MAG: glycosyltransferase [Pseudomonadota bacterium]|nr:glycosyltransferase [Pseudomonadota bacterium]